MMSFSSHKPASLRYYLYIQDILLKSVKFGLLSFGLVNKFVNFISGLPDSLLGSAWPVTHDEISVPISFAGIVSGTIFVGTILSSLFSNKLLHRFGAGKVTAASVIMTAIGLFGFSISNQFWILILWSIPYGLGAFISPYIMNFSLIQLEKWNYEYLIVSLIQAVLSIIIFISLSLWKTGNTDDNESTNDTKSKALSFGEIFTIKGAIPCFLLFFCYCSMELTTSLWTSTYLVQNANSHPKLRQDMQVCSISVLRLANLLTGSLQ